MIPRNRSGRSESRTWNTSLRWLCADQMRGVLAGTAGTFVLSWMLYELTGSKAAMGGLWLLSLSGQWLVQWIVGPFIDRWKRITVMKVSEMVRGTAYLFVFLMWITGNKAAYVLMLGSFLSSVQIYDAAAGALLPKLAPADRLVRVNAAISGSVQLIRVLALPAAGLLTSVLAPEILLLMLSLLFCGVWITSAFIQEAPQASLEKRSWKASFHNGIQVYQANPVLYGLALLVSVTSFGVFATQSMYIPYVSDVLDGGPIDFGLFSASFPLGYVLGSIIIGRLREPGPYLYVVMSGALFAGGVTYLLLGAVTQLTAALLIEMAAGMMMPFWNVYSSTLYYRIVPETVLGQVLSVRSLLTKAMTPLGVMYGTYCASAYGLPQLFQSVGILICIISGVGMLVAGRSAARRQDDAGAAEE